MSAQLRSRAQGSSCARAASASKFAAMQRQCRQQQQRVRHGRGAASGAVRPAQGEMQR